MTVRTRFAPSPTGYLHIGGVRTALFCWLFAERHAGRFILRIDDTDQQRNVQEALRPILEGLKWLGIDWDEGPEVGGPYGPYYQSERTELYEAAVEELLRRGFAYRDYATPEEFQAEREAAQADKREFVYSRRWMAETPADYARFEAEGRQSVVRLKMPREGSLTINDLIRGQVEFQWAREQDHVIQRADGSCLYHLANVVDDQAMRITHVIRAEEHLSNTPRQVFIGRSLGYEMPEYAHLPFVAEPGSKVKLSKRKLDKYLKNRDFADLLDHGRRIAEAIGLETRPEEFNPVVVDFYREIGFLSEAIVNYLALLGWSLDDRTEHFRPSELVQHFSLDRVNRAPASFDPVKLQAFQDYHMQQLPLADKTVMVLPYLQRAGRAPAPAGADVETRVTQVLQAAGDRIKVAGDILDYDEFFTPDDALVFDEKAIDKRLRKPADAVGLLGRFRAVLAECEPFDAATLDAQLHGFVEVEGIQIGQMIHALRVAVTGKSVGLGMFDTLAILGRESCLARIDRALQLVQNRPAG
ncbi:MAG: glutamate--tRNA ligase [Pirellulales bacterium]|nr:glutamate--tRNA ligase [Pirellulales bacterium]